MITLLYTIILVAAMAAPLLLLQWFDRRHKRKRQAALISQFQHAGQNAGLRFSSQEMLPQTIIGLDGLGRQLLLAEQHDDDLRYTLVSLDHVNGVHLVTKNQAPNQSVAALIKSAKVKVYLGLQINLADGNSIAVPFYDRHINKPHEYPALAVKARHWQTLLLKLLTPGVPSQ